MFSACGSRFNGKYLTRFCDEPVLCHIFVSIQGILLISFFPDALRNAGKKWYAAFSIIFLFFDGRFRLFVGVYSEMTMTVFTTGAFFGVDN